MARHKKFYIKLFFLLVVAVGSIYDGVSTITSFSKPQGSLKIYDNQGSLIYESINASEGYQSHIDIDQLPEYVTQAFISAEDSNYYYHLGFDPFAIVRAIYLNLREGRLVFGGSTITQQVSRQFLEPKISFSIFRKIREINSAVFLELYYTKKEILEKYLNTVYFGNNSYGVESASRTYFNKPASQLSLGESATLAGSIRAPVILNPSSNDLAWERRNAVLKQMEEARYINLNQYNDESSFPLGLNMTKRENSYMHMVDFAIYEALLKLNLKDASNLSGYSIYTTMSAPITDAALLSAKSNVARLKDEHKLTNAAVVVLDSTDSAILAMVGSIDYFNKEIDGAVNVATSLRQPGSALKPFTYGEVFAQGVLSPEDTILDEKTTFTDKKGESFVPFNYNGEFNGLVSVKTALASSLNLPAVKVLKMVGVESMINAVRRAGVHTLNDPDKYDLSVTLGGGDVTLLDLSNAYNSLARKGYYKEPYAVAEIKDSKNNSVYTHVKVEPQPVWGDKSETTAGILFDILSAPDEKVLGFGRANVLILPFKAASKTGTTTDWHDNWTFGFTDKFTVGVWAGNTDNSPMYNIDGVTGAGAIWRDVMLTVYSELNRANPTTEVPLETIESSPSAKLVKPQSQVVPQAALAITNPAPNSKYYLNPDESEFEKIKFEVAFTPEVYAVEYILDGRKSTFNVAAKDNFSYLWTPEKGTHNLIARFYNSKNILIYQASTNFSVF